MITTNLSANIHRVIQKELTEKEIMEIDMRFLGNIIFEKAKTISLRVDCELLKPISAWTKDSDWMKKIQRQGYDKPDWAKYKSRSRQWTKQQKHLAHERLKLYWQEIHKKRHYKTKLLNTTEKNENIKVNNSLNQFIDTSFLSDIVAQFSPVQQSLKKIAFEFNQACKLSISNLLPWKTIMISELTETVSTTLNSMKVLLTENKKLDKISKFQHLLQMNMDGEISLEQVEHTDQIQIILKATNQKPEIKIKDKSGQSYTFNWLSLNEAQRTKIISDTIERKILCRSVDNK